MDRPDCSSPDELHGTLIALLGGHGIIARAEGDWITFAEHPGRMHGLIFDLMAQHPEADEGRLADLLVNAGLSAVDARRVLLLVPIAFGRYVLEGLGIVVSTVCTVDDGVSRTSIDLQSSDIFQEASVIAKKALLEGAITRDELLAIARRDASVKAASELLHAGTDRRNLVLAPLTILWREQEPLCEARPIELKPKDKPWWRIWS